MKIAIFVLILLVGVVFASQSRIDAAFSKFVSDYKKQYKGTREFNLRRKIFGDNFKLIEEHNAKNLSFTMGINQFADLTNPEFQSLYCAKRFDATKFANKDIPIPVREGALPTEVDWVKKGVVTHIKNQGQCGSCWSFSTTGNVEGAYAIATKNLVSLSEQQLVDCSDSYGNEGCNGGLMDDAFQYIIAVGGLESETEYPYTAQDGTCHSNKALFKADISGYTDVTSGSETALQMAVADVGPISVAIDAGLSSFQFYNGGVYYDPNCSSTQLDHGVLAVGYGVYQGTTDYWLVKNSWGTSWGLSGYIMMSRNKNNNCGIATMASYSTGAKNPSL